MGVLLRMIVKEFLQLRQDRKMIPMLIVGPVVQLVVFGFAVNTDVRDVPMLLVDQDRTAESRALAERFARSGYFDVVGSAESAGAAEEWFVDGRAQIALVIGRGFARSLETGRVPRVQVLADGTDASAATVTLGYAKGVMAARNREWVHERVALVLAAHATAFPGRTVVVPRVWYNPDLLSRWYYVPAVLAMILMTLTMLLSAMAVVREKEIGTLEQLMVTPLRPWQLLVGKLAPFGLIGAAQVFLVTAIAVWGFGVPLRGSFLLLLFLTQLFLLNTLGLGLLVSTLVDTQQQAMMLTTFGLMVPMIYLSGLIFPIENMPVAIQFVTYAIPVRYYAQIIRGVFLRGSGLDVLWPQALVLGLMGASILGLAAMRFRKRIA